MYHDKNKLTAASKAFAHLRTKSDADPLEVLANKFADMTDATMERIAGAEAKSDSIMDLIDKVEKKMATQNGIGGFNARSKSWGEQFTEERKSDLTALSQANSGQVNLSVKGTLTGGAASAGAMDVPDHVGTVTMPKRRMMVRSVLNVVGTESGTVEYASQTTRTNAADMIAEGDQKPESDYAWELKNVPTRVIAHWVKASNQIMSDVPQIQGMIDSELRYGLALKEEEQILFGDGSGANLNGLTPNATEFVDPVDLPNKDMIDVIGAAILQVSLANFTPDAIIMHPSDWMRARLLRDADGNYILGRPQAVVEPNLFGVPVIPTQAMPSQKFLVGSFANAATLYDRWSPRVEMGYVNDDFTRNLVTIRAEERIALAVKQPDAMSFGDFAVATTA